MTISLLNDLSQAWIDYIKAGHTYSDFPAGYDDPEGNWQVGDQVRVGLRLDDAGNPGYFAHNLTQSREIVYKIRNEAIGQDFWKNFNPYRRLKPNSPEKRQPGPLAAPSPDIFQCGYKCQEPNHPWSLLSRDPIAVLLMPNGYWACYYNFSPFEQEGHFLWLPVEVNGNVIILPHYPQVMKREFLADGISLFRKSKGLLYFFNSLHAGASQNHFHFQAVSTCGNKFAIEKMKVPAGKTSSYLTNYHIEGLSFSLYSSVDDIFECIQGLRNAGIPYNLVMVGDTIYLIPRNAQHEIVTEFPYGVLASMEMAGKLIISDKKNYDQTDYPRVVSAFKKISLDRDEIADKIHI